ncbi:hypothetical protein [Neobacillus dielmonensis]|uniref:hypothetical protein n=1 Tax=Neobacillus dielmonensis TaxID=1347369 RepID=UPI0005A6325C|nr:hypothetical protein [Neobacillus dielmonensis]
MKKLVMLIFGVFIALALFTVTGSPVQAAEPDDDCTCHDLLPITGAERNKIVAKFLSSQEFQAKKAELLATGHTWNGAHTIEVILPAGSVTMVGVPFVDADGVPLMYAFVNGMFVGTAPVE